MGTAAATKQTYFKGDMSAKKLHALILEHNQGVQDDHTLAAKLDADGTVDTTTYESGLTALEIAIEDADAVETATAVTYDSTHLSEALLTAVVEQINARITDIEGVVTKLNADTGVSDGDYASTAAKVNALGETGVGQLYGGAGSGVSGAVIQALTDTHNTLTQDWHDLTAKLDADEGVTDDDYEDEIVARTLTEG